MEAKWQTGSKVYKQYLQNIVLLYQNRQDIRIFTEVLLSVASIVIFGVFAIKPTLVTIAGLFTEIKGKQQTIQILDQKIENLVAAQAIFEQERSKIELLNTAIPDDPDPHGYLRQVEGIADKNGVGIKNFTMGNVVLIGEVQTVVTGTEETEQPVLEGEQLESSISVTGGYSNLISFLTELESMRRPLFSQIVKVNITEGEQIEELVLTATGLVPFLRIVND